MLYVWNRGAGPKNFLSKRPAPLPPGRVGAGFSKEHMSFIENILFYKIVFTNLCFIYLNIIIKLDTILRIVLGNIHEKTADFISY